ncbi:MAG: YifB family Mg chelatase-like AAA ATPase [Candidatus Pelagadaptatus aseana]|uniref:YifB family Mg chelatase-like AAA ATPase n=1 Tax=Candidatus Pelagadaptatus aseana TaxID=3120508 RepID=UPI0039B1DC77
MSLAIVYSRANYGIEAPLVTVEVHLSNGLPALSIVGMAETSVRESRDRVRSAILNSQFEFPARRITINMAPAELPKQGGQFDLAIALGILVASGQVPEEKLQDYEFVGELSLNGGLRPTAGILPAAQACGAQQRRLICCAENGPEASLCEATEVLSSHSLLDVVAHLFGQQPLLPHPPVAYAPDAQATLDLSEVKGQLQAKRALEIAAAGQHHLLMFGAPGTGKSMLASRLPGLLPVLTREEAMEVAAIQSVSRQKPQAPLGYPARPFVAPHHTASAAALVGGGPQPRPGEISLAHRGVLFLDELPEFQRQVLEVLREPLENGFIRVSRAAAQMEFPCRFQLVAAMNPCPCGYWGDERGRCRCTPDQVNRYRGKISGPLLDRIDLHIPVQPLASGDLYRPVTGEDSPQIAGRVAVARSIQYQRQGCYNGQLQGQKLMHHCALSARQQSLLETATDALGLSARALHRVLKVARTIADLAAREALEDNDIHEALSYRVLDRQCG